MKLYILDDNGEVSFELVEDSSGEYILRVVTSREVTIKRSIAILNAALRLMIGHLRDGHDDGRRH